jgi:hypothetical protein
MPMNDPTSTGGLFIGRRPGTAPLRSVVLGIVTAFVGMLVTMLGTIGVAMRLDRAWKIVRRAAGHEQKSGMLERIFAISVMIGATAFFVWLFVIHGPCPEVSPCT